MLTFGFLGQTDRTVGRDLLIALALFHRLEVAPLGGLMRLASRILDCLFNARAKPTLTWLSLYVGCLQILTH
jgi:hypothetical protein